MNNINKRTIIEKIAAKVNHITTGYPENDVATDNIEAKANYNIAVLANKAGLGVPDTKDIQFKEHKLKSQITTMNVKTGKILNISPKNTKAVEIKINGASAIQREEIKKGISELSPSIATEINEFILLKNSGKSIFVFTANGIEDIAKILDIKKHKNIPTLPDTISEEVKLVSNIERSSNVVELKATDHTLPDEDQKFYLAVGDVEAWNKNRPEKADLRGKTFLNKVEQVQIGGKGEWLSVAGITGVETLGGKFEKQEDNVTFTPITFDIEQVAGSKHKRLAARAIPEKKISFTDETQISAIISAKKASGEIHGFRLGDLNYDNIDLSNANVSNSYFQTSMVGAKWHGATGYPTSMKGTVIKDGEGLTTNIFAVWVRDNKGIDPQIDAAKNPDIANQLKTYMSTLEPETERKIS